jgi:hypothetical protein
MGEGGGEDDGYGVHEAIPGRAGEAEEGGVGRTAMLVPRQSIPLIYPSEVSPRSKQEELDVEMSEARADLVSSFRIRSNSSSVIQTFRGKV